MCLQVISKVAQSGHTVADLFCGNLCINSPQTMQRFCAFLGHSLGQYEVGILVVLYMKALPKVLFLVYFRPL